MLRRIAAACCLTLKLEISCKASERGLFRVADIEVRGMVNVRSICERGRLAACIANLPDRLKILGQNLPGLFVLAKIHKAVRDLTQNLRSRTQLRHGFGKLGRLIEN